MSGVAEAIGLVSAILGIATQISKLADTAQRNMEKCKLLGDHVGTIMVLLDELKKHMKPEAWTKQLLENLNDALWDGMALVQSCQEKRSWSRVFKTQKKAKKFDALDQRISRILDQFHLANMILIVTMNNGRFFENVLQKLLQHGACERLPQNVKDELKSSITRLTNTDNMSSDAQDLLKRIKRDITYSCRDVATSGSSGAQRDKKAPSTGDYLMVDILDLTKRIMERAPTRNGGEIQRLVNLVKQVANIIQHLQTSELPLDRNTRTKTLVDLKEDLDRISDNIYLYNGKDHNKVKRVMLCGPDNAYEYEVLQDAYKIEYYIQVLVIALRRLYERN
ncbi:unnamed protein product [Alopecurus aequalis]